MAAVLVVFPTLRNEGVDAIDVNEEDAGMVIGAGVPIIGAEELGFPPSRAVVDSGITVVVMASEVCTGAAVDVERSDARASEVVPVMESDALEVEGGVEDAGWESDSEVVIARVSDDIG
eukprot:1732349-Rhodomonas_salina.1